MASFSVRIQTSAEAELLSVPFPFRRQINQRLMKLRGDPRPPEAVLIEGTLHRLSVGEWRVLYDIDDEAAVLTILAIRRIA